MKQEEAERRLQCIFTPVCSTVSRPVTRPWCSQVLITHSVSKTKRKEVLIGARHHHQLGRGPQLFATQKKCYFTQYRQYGRGFRVWSSSRRVKDQTRMTRQLHLTYIRPYKSHSKWLRAACCDPRCSHTVTLKFVKRMREKLRYGQALA